MHIVPDVAEVNLTSNWADLFMDEIFTLNYATCSKQQKNILSIGTYVKVLPELGSA